MRNTIKQFYQLSIAIVILGNITACKKHLEIDPPIDGLVTENVYTTKAGIDAAVIGMYNAFTSYAFTSNYLRTVFLMSDEGNYAATQAGDVGALINANVLPTNTNIPALAWFYGPIYKANDIIEHLGTLPAGIITDSLRNAYIGAAKYIRAAEHFTMVSSWGDIPLVTSTSVNINAALTRTPAVDVYAAVVKDLQDAATLLPATVLPASQMYIHNKYQALALLAKVQLYMGNWTDAEASATTVINSGQFSLVTTGLNNVIKRGSREIITAQGYSSSIFQYVFYANILLPTSATTAGNFPSLSAAMMTNFEAADLRKVAGNWMVLFNANNYCNKYALTASATAPQDFSYQRLAELYLIRAEARTQLNNITGAATDINSIRTRAGLVTGTTATDKTTMMAAIEKERICELFFEGHRWYDLKRWGKLDAVLGTLSWKSTNYKPYFNLWPIQQLELDRSPTLKQNPGYPQ